MDLVYWRCGGCGSGFCWRHVVKAFYIAIAVWMASSILWREALFEARDFGEAADVTQARAGEEAVNEAGALEVDMLKVGGLEGTVGECCVAERYVPEPGAAEVGVFDGSVVKGDVADFGAGEVGVVELRAF